MNRLAMLIAGLSWISMTEGGEPNAARETLRSAVSLLPASMSARGLRPLRAADLFAAPPVRRTGGAALRAADRPERISPTAANGVPTDGFALRSGVCDDAIYSTGDADGVNGLSSERGNFGIESFCADDARVDSDTEIGALHWQALVSGDYGDSTVDVLVLPNGGGIPNGDDSTALLSESDDVACRVDTGKGCFGFPIIQYSYYPASGLKIPAGTTWFAARPVSGSGGGRAFWATANYGAPQGQPGVFRSAYFGYPDWSNAVNQLGDETDFAMCITRALDGGSCCIAGDCFETTKEDCAGQGGTYNDGVPCCGTVCAGRAAGCCFDDGTCEDLKPAECEERGGIPQGDENLCRGGLCPLPDFCTDTLYSQFGYDGEDALSAQDSGDIGWIDSETADDAVFAGAVEVTGAVWQTIDRGNPDITLGDYGIFYAISGGGPGRLISEGDNVTLDLRLTDGTSLFGGTVWFYKIGISTTRAVPGGYYFSLRPRIDEFVQSFRLTSPGGNDEAYFRSPFLGYSNWVPVSSVLGVAYEFSFCVLGVESDTPLGACCLDGGSRCELLTETECSAAGGFYQGNDYPCFPGTCPNEPGACCDPTDGTCIVTDRESCIDSGLEFQGSGDECVPGLCRLDRVCDTALYSQFGSDGWNGLANQDSSSIGWIDAWTSDNAVLKERVVVTGVVAEVLIRGRHSAKYADAFVAYASNKGPSKPIIEVDDVEVDVPLDDCLFGPCVRTLLVQLPPTRAVPGTVYVGARVRLDEYVQAFLATAQSDDETAAYFKGAIFGYANWTPVETVAGVPYEFSFCLLGRTTDEEFGACCSDDEATCALLTQAECDALGGRYVGTDAPCFPAPCTNTPGACCFLDPYGCEDGTVQGDCESRGGVFQGGDTECAAGVCPLPDFCENSYYSQIGYNGTAVYFNGDVSIRGFEYWTADDFTAGVAIELTAIATQSADYSFGGDLEGIEEFQYAVWASTNAGPGKELAAGSSTSFERGTDGSLLFGSYNIYQNRVNFSDAVRLVASDYYISARPVINGNFSSYLPTAEGGGQPGYNRYNGGEWSNTGWDFSFCVIAARSEDAFGACCTGDETVCTILTNSECDVAGGRYTGDSAPCFPNPCKKVLGACCFESGECSFLSAGDCAASGGHFQGGDVECAPGVCPIPDPCDGEHGDVLFNNSRMDGKNALLSMDGRESVGFEIFGADDATFDGDVTVGGMHWYEWGTPGITVNGGDYIIITDNGGTPLGGDEIVNVEDTTFVRLATGEKVFGYYDVYQNSFKGLNVPLSAGTYWFALRVNVTDANYAYWPTAALIGNRYHWRGEQFGCPDWCEGDNSDLAYCLTAPPDRCTGVSKADSDGGGKVDFNDIDCFVAALISFEDWEACGTVLSGMHAYVCANDTNASGAVDFDDIDSFVQCIVDGGCE